MLYSTHCVGEGASAMSETDLEPRESVEDTAHEEAADGGGGLRRHPHQPRQPVLGVPAPHRHVPRVDKQRGAQILARLHTADITS